MEYCGTWGGRYTTWLDRRIVCVTIYRASYWRRTATTGYRRRTATTGYIQRAARRPARLTMHDSALADHTPLQVGFRNPLMLPTTHILVHARYPLRNACAYIIEYRSQSNAFSRQKLLYQQCVCVLVWISSWMHIIILLLNKGDW